MIGQPGVCEAKLQRAEFSGQRLITARPERIGASAPALTSRAGPENQGDNDHEKYH